MSRAANEQFIEHSREVMDVEGNRVLKNLFINNGANPPPGGPHSHLAGDIVFGSVATAGSNCFRGNVYEQFSTIANPPASDVVRSEPLPPAPCE